MWKRIAALLSGAAIVAYLRVILRRRPKLPLPPVLTLGRSRWEAGKLWDHWRDN